jgi:hypothetical protein
MTFLIWHLLAIVGVMAVSFIAGYWYATASYIRFQRTRRHFGLYGNKEW